MKYSSNGYSSIKNLIKYLIHKISQPSRQIPSIIPWKACLAVVDYAEELSSYYPHDHHHALMNTIKRLEDIASQFSAKWDLHEYLQKEEEMYEIIVNSFVPQAQIYFNVPTSDEYPLTFLIIFLFQTLENCQPSRALMGNQQFFPVIIKELKFLAAVLWDIMLHFTANNHLGDLLKGIQDVANEAGCFIYQFVFPTDQIINLNWFSVCIHVLLYKFHLLNAKIKDHCAQFSGFPEISDANQWSSTDTLNSHLEIALLEDLMNRRLDSIDDDMKDHTEKLHEELRSTQSFLQVVIPNLMRQKREIDGLKECVIPIRKVTAEAKFLITKCVGKHFHVWYMSLRLRNVITKFEIIGKGFNKIIKVLDLQLPVDCGPEESSENHHIDSDQIEEIQLSTAHPSITHLSKYLTGRDFNGTIELTWRVTEQSDQSLPWNSLSCLAVVCYVLKSSSDSNHDDALIDTIRRLNHLASVYNALNNYMIVAEESPQRVKIEREISEMFVNSFMPNAQRFFTLPKSSFPGSNIELLAGFIHFLLQILNSEGDSKKQAMWFVSIQKGLMFLLAVVEDIPFQRGELEEVRNLQEEFETVVNEAGIFIFSCAFTTLPVDIIWFCVCMHVLIYKFHLLNAIIKEHCIRFSMLPKVSVNPKNNTPAATVDALFIVESLIVDLENLMNRDLHLTIGDMKDQIEKLHDRLMSARSLLMLHDKEIEQIKDRVIQIRDAAYEAEYLINSLVSGHFPIWYVTLRLPNVFPKLDILDEDFEEVKKIDDIHVREALETSMVVSDNIFVGYENEAVQILGELTGRPDKLQTILVFGMPGIGKTTLAKKLYNDCKSSQYFDEYAWCAVSQTYRRRKVLMDLLISLRSMPDKDEVLKMEDDNLIDAIYKSLIKRKYLIVIDDVWSADMWNDLNRYFPNDGTGSRILFTSRVSDVAPTGSIIHTLPLMSEDQCWELLQKKLFSEEHCPPQLVEFGKQIAAKSNGLPLLVVIIAGILANLEMEKSVWEKVEKSLDSYKSNCMEILELSYKQLPNRLKLCFLYLGVFPEDAEISARKLIWLWIAEGFIPKEEGKTPENVAEEYLNSLIDRSLVLIAKNKSTGGVKACIVHDLLRDMSLKKAQEENFLTVINDDHFSTYEKHQRLCVHSKDLAYLRPFSLHCRSFFGYLSDPSSCFPQMKHARIMELPRNIEDVGLSYKLRRLDLLVGLRYLVVDRLPESILSNLVNLEFLRIDSLDHAVYLPSTILKMEKLRHLHVRIQAKFKKDCDISQTNNLETLSFFSIYNPKAYEILKSSPHLRKLKCMCPPILPDFHFLTNLESLKIIVRDIFQIPKNCTAINFPSTVRKLTFYGICLPWARMSVLGRLPNLQVLKLLADAFVGEEWETGDGEFQELRFLKFQDLQLKEWIASSEHFPKLGHLVLNRCKKLQKIPSEFGEILTLQMIQVHDCSEEASRSALEIEQEQRNYGNEELKVIITNERWSKQQLLSKYREEQNSP